MAGYLNLRDFQFPLDIIQEAKQLSMKRSKNNFTEFLHSLEQPQMHCVLKFLPCAVGLPLEIFLRRLASVGEFVSKHKKVSTVSVVEANISAITDFIDEGAIGVTKRVGTVKRVEALRQLCELANTPRRFRDFDEWIKHHTAQLHNALVYCLNVENPLVVEETCLTIAFLARKFHFSLFKTGETLVTAMVTTMALAMGPTESHVEHLRKALDFHAEMEISKARTLEFHFPRLNYEFEEPKFRLIGYVYYALADFLYNVPHPFLIHFFQCRILRRKEFTRKLLFKILLALVENMAELEEFAKKHCPRTEKSKTQAAEKPAPVTGVSKPILTTKNVSDRPSLRNAVVEKVEDAELGTWIYKPELYSAEQWEILPSKLYIEMLRGYNDRNAENRACISTIMTILRSIAHVKLPALDVSLGNKLDYLKSESVDRFSKRIRIATPKTAGSGSGEDEAEAEDNTIAKTLTKTASQDPVSLATVLQGETTERASSTLLDGTEGVDVGSDRRVEEGGHDDDSGYSQAESGSFRSDSDVLGVINRPTVLLSRPPKLNKLNR